MPFLGDLPPPERAGRAGPLSSLALMSDMLAMSRLDPEVRFFATGQSALSLSHPSSSYASGSNQSSLIEDDTSVAHLFHSGLGTLGVFADKLGVKETFNLFDDPSEQTVE